MLESKVRPFFQQLELNSKSLTSSTEHSLTRTIIKCFFYCAQAQPRTELGEYNHIIVAHFPIISDVYMASALCTKTQWIPAEICSLFCCLKSNSGDPVLYPQTLKQFIRSFFYPLTQTNKGLQRILRFTMSDRWACGSGCWTQGQMEGFAAYRTRRWSPQRPRQSPCGTATGTDWEEPGWNHLLGRRGGRSTHVKTNKN